MKPLSGMDNLFLQMEHGNQYMHVAGLGIYDQTTAPGGSVRFKQILDFYAKKLNKSKIFRRRLVVPPFNIDRPYWVEDGEIDIEYHVRHMALPQPGDWRQLMIQIARIHARPLDRSKPLWEAYVIEGLNNINGVAKGSFAVYTKFHHALVDGEAGAQVIGMIHSLTPDPEDDDNGPSIIIADREPTKVELYSRAVAHRGGQLLDTGKLLAKLGSRVGLAGMHLASSGKLIELGQQLLAKATSAKDARADNSDGKAGKKTSPFQRKPHTRFDVDVSPHRIVDAVGFSLADCKTIRDHVDEITINDIFIAACGGAVRRYLQAKGELPKESLTALMPISTRSKSQGSDSGNQVGMVPVPLRSDIIDPIERLRGARKGSSASKGASSALGHDFSAKLIQIMPAFAAEAIINHGMVPMCNTTVSNVRGPSVPLYMAGSKLQVFLPVSISFNGIGLNMTGFSYNGMLWVRFVCCRSMMPDPKFFRECLNESFAEIVAAATKLPRHGGAPASVDKGPAKAPAKAPSATKSAKQPAAKRPARKGRPVSPP